MAASGGKDLVRGGGGAQTTHRRTRGARGPRGRVTEREGGRSGRAGVQRSGLLASVSAVTACEGRQNAPAPGEWPPGEAGSAAPAARPALLAGGEDRFWRL